jgi:hypothetical protein
MSKGNLRRKPKRVLRLPDLDHAKTAVLSTLASSGSQRCYRYAIEDFCRVVLLGAKARFQQDRGSAVSATT